jgi:hypothetical protein
MIWQNTLILLWRCSERGVTLRPPEIAFCDICARCSDDDDRDYLLCNETFCFLLLFHCHFDFHAMWMQKMWRVQTKALKETELSFDSMGKSWPTTLLMLYVKWRMKMLEIRKDTACVSTWVKMTRMWCVVWTMTNKQKKWRLCVDCGVRANGTCLPVNDGRM